MSVRVALIGCGRMGRDIFRLLHGQGHGHGEVVVAAIAEVAAPDSLAYLLKYDSVRGRLEVPLSRAGEMLQVGQHEALLLGAAAADDAVDWREHGIDVVIEASGRRRSRAELAQHLERGAKRVISCTPGATGLGEACEVTVAVGHNDASLQPAQRLIGLASPAAQAALHAAAALQEAFGIERLFCSAVRAYGQDQPLADVPGADLRRSRAAAVNIVPAPATLGAELEALLPSLRGRVAAHELRVPVANGSMLDVVAFTQRPASVVAANEALRAAALRAPHIAEYCADPMVSCDVKQRPQAAVFDGPATMALGSHGLKVLAWYDNSWGYAHRAVELVALLAQRPGGL